MAMFEVAGEELLYCVYTVNSSPVLLVAQTPRGNANAMVHVVGVWSSFWPADDVDDCLRERVS